MRTFIAMLTAAALWGSLAGAEEVRERRVVYLNGPAALAELEDAVYIALVVVESSEPTVIPAR